MWRRIHNRRRREAERGDVTQVRRRREAEWRETRDVQSRRGVLGEEARDRRLVERPGGLAGAQALGLQPLAVDAAY